MKFFDKPVGLTPNDFKYSLIEKGLLSKRSCCFGRLDPQARGIEPFLEDEEVKQMDKYLFNTNKTYEAEIIFGLSTDTDDIMGMFDNEPDIPDYNQYLLVRDKLVEEIKNMVGKGQHKQKFHPFSSFMLRKDGYRKPLWEWQKEGRLQDEEIPEKNVELYELKILEHKKYSLYQFIEDCVHRLDIVNKKHNFRQSEIIEQWQNLKKHEEDTSIYSVKIKLQASSGYFVRQLGNDLKRTIKFPLMIFDINRTGIDLKD